MNVQNTTEYGMRDVAADTSLQRFSFNIFNRITPPLLLTTQRNANMAKF